MTNQEYVLGTDQVELARLKLQHDLWKDHLVRLWKKSDIKPGQSILELGCGPGFTTEELLKFMNGDVKVTAVDISEDFLKYLDSKKYPQVTTHNSYLEDLNLPKKDYDLAFCRWLMIFVPDLHKAIQQIHKHIKPNGYFLAQEYISYDSFSLSPEVPIMKTIVDAIFKSWMDQGGYPNQGKRLPQVLEMNGFEVLEIEPIARTMRPTDPLWQWPESFWDSFLPRLVKGNYITQGESDQFSKEWEKAKTTIGAFCVAPTVVNIVARKK